MLKAERPQPLRGLENDSWLWKHTLKGLWSHDPPLSCMANLFFIIRSGHSNLQCPSSYFPGEILAVLDPAGPCLPVARVTAGLGERGSVAMGPLFTADMMGSDMWANQSHCMDSSRCLGQLNASLRSSLSGLHQGSMFLWWHVQSSLTIYVSRMAWNKRTDFQQ